MELSKIFSILSNRKKRIEVRHQIAERCGVSATTISNWMSGRTKPPRIYHKVLAEIMGIPVAELFPTTEKCSA